MHLISPERTLRPSRVGAHIFVVLTTFATFFLLATGGLVTSKGVGMAVPDWPTTFGYNMFAFPFDRWVGGVFYEHFHRVVASGVGLLTAIMAVWLLIVEPRRWVKVLAVSAGIAVVIQGLLGGLRVTLIKSEIGIFHGMLAQAFFVLLGILCLATAPSFVSGRFFGRLWRPSGVQWIALGLVIAIFVQLGIAASMRHAHAGLSIPDFPLAYGQVIPATDPETIRSINAVRLEGGEMPTSAAQIWLQMKHRVLAIGILGMAVWLATISFRRGSSPPWLRRLSAALLIMVVLQVALGAWTIWSNKAADVATAHMALGALILFFAGRLAFRCFACERVAAAEALEFPRERPDRIVA